MTTAPPLEGSPVLVTGASGFIGSHLVAALVARGAAVHALRRDGRPMAGATVHGVDLLDEGAVARRLAEVRPTVVFHLAAYGARPEESDRQRMVRVNVEAALHLWQALPPSVARVVTTGTGREFAPATRPVTETYPCAPASPYPGSKHAGTTLLSALARADRRPLVVVRPFGPYGPGDHSDRVIPATIRRLLRGEVIDLTDAAQVYDFGYIDDHVEALLAAAAAPQRETVAAFNIGGGLVQPLRETLEAVADAVGPAARGLLRFGALPRRTSDTEYLCADLAAAREALGYAPRVALADGLRRTVAWHRERMAGKDVA